jgi:hypothetical protein
MLFVQSPIVMSLYPGSFWIHCTYSAFIERCLHERLAPLPCGFVSYCSQNFTETFLAIRESKLANACLVIDHYGELVSIGLNFDNKLFAVIGVNCLAFDSHHLEKLTYARPAN